MYKERTRLRARVKEASRVLQMYPERVPVICERRASCTTLPNVDKIKYLVPRDITIGQFVHVLRTRLCIPSTQALFLLTDSGYVPPLSQQLRLLYSSCGDEDGFLYLCYAGENTFGS